MGGVPSSPRDLQIIDISCRSIAGRSSSKDVRDLQGLLCLASQKVDSHEDSPSSSHLLCATEDAEHKGSLELVL